MPNPDLQKALAERAKRAIDEAIRQKKFRSLNALAHAAGVDRTQLDRFLRQKQGMNAADFLSVCRVLGMELTDTVHDAGGQSPGDTVVEMPPKHGEMDGPQLGTLAQGGSPDATVNFLPTALARGTEHALRQKFEADLDPVESIVWRGKEAGLSNAEIARQLNKGKSLVDEISKHLYRRWDKMSAPPKQHE